MPAPYPQFIPRAFAINAAGANRNTIPNNPVTTQRASFDLGFPPLTMTPVVAGGKPMLGPDMNGVLYMMSTHTVYVQSGKAYLWDANVAAAIGGYAIGTLLGSTDGLTLWFNTTAANSTDPDAGGAGWVPMYSYGITTVAGLIGGTTTLSKAQASKSVIILTGALAANQQIVLPNDLRRWLIVNATTGAFNLTVKTAAGTGVVVPQGGLNAPVEVWGNGTNIYNVVAPVNLPIDQAPTALSIAQRTNAGYLLATYFNQSSGLENFAMSAVFAETGNDGYHRKISPANFAAQFPFFGINGQNWQQPSRAFDVGYTNSTGRPIQVNVNFLMLYAGGTPGTIVAVVNGGVAAADSWLLPGINQHNFLSFTVPPGYNYSVSITGGCTLSNWSELR